MTIGAGIFLIAVGAILKFAIDAHVQGISVDTIGVILIIAGVVGLIVGIFQELLWSRRRRVAPAEPPVEDPRDVRQPGYREPPPRY